MRLKNELKKEVTLDIEKTSLLILVLYFYSLSSHLNTNNDKQLHNRNSAHHPLKYGLIKDHTQKANFLSGLTQYAYGLHLNC